MELYLYPNLNRKVKQSFLEKLNEDNVFEYKELMKRLNNGQKIYAYWSPYDEEINKKDMLYWYLDPEECLNYYSISKEEI